MVWSFDWSVEEEEVGGTWGGLDDYSPIFMIDFAGVILKRYLESTAEEDTAGEQAI